MVAMGIDVGTRFVKGCILRDGEIISSSVLPSGGDIKSAVKKTVETSAKAAGIKEKEIRKIISTGFGGNMVKSAAFTVNEGAASAKAASAISGEIRTVIDIGALFIRITSLKNGRFLDTAENEKCASGSGKFIEMVAGALAVPFEEISSLAEKSKDPYTVTNHCAVFAESEVITQVNSGRESADIICGVINSIVSKVETMLKTSRSGEMYLLCGGALEIPYLKNKLSEKLSGKIEVTSISPRIIPAYGAALIAGE